MTDFSKTQVRNAGKLVRDFFASADTMATLAEDERERVASAYDLVEAYRSTFATPLLKVRVGLQSFAKTCGYPGAEIAQRHKRMARIMQKLIRYPSMNLTTMQDIGGCRVIVADLEALGRVKDHIHMRWDDSMVNEYDYIANPRESGYRAHHIVVRRDDCLIEIQLRTERQHGWADLVEAMSRRLGTELKWEGGSDAINDFFLQLSDASAYGDRGEPIPVDLVETIKKYIEQVDNIDS